MANCCKIIRVYEIFFGKNFDFNEANTICLKEKLRSNIRILDFVLILYLNGHHEKKVHFSLCDVFVRLQIELLIEHRKARDETFTSAFMDINWG